MNINRITADVINQIFGHLDAPDLMTSKLVCKDWNQLINTGLGTWVNTPSNREFAAQVLLECYCSQSKEKVMQTLQNLEIEVDKQKKVVDEAIKVQNIIKTIFMGDGVAFLQKNSFSFQDLVEVCRAQRSDVAKNLLCIIELVNNVQSDYLFEQIDNYKQTSDRGEIDNAEGVSENSEHTDDTKGESLSQATKLAEKFFPLANLKAMPKAMSDEVKAMSDEAKERYIKLQKSLCRLLLPLLCKKFSLEELKGLLSFLESSVGINFYGIIQQLPNVVGPKVNEAMQDYFARKDPLDSEEDF